MPYVSSLDFVPTAATGLSAFDALTLSWQRSDDRKSGLDVANMADSTQTDSNMKSGRFNGSFSGTSSLPFTDPKTSKRVAVSGDWGAPRLNPC